MAYSLLWSSDAYPYFTPTMNLLYSLTIYTDLIQSSYIWPHIMRDSWLSVSAIKYSQCCWQCIMKVCRKVNIQYVLYEIVIAWIQMLSLSIQVVTMWECHTILEYYFQFYIRSKCNRILSTLEIFYHYWCLY
jgi:hypothetical protein